MLKDNTIFVDTTKFHPEPVDPVNPVTLAGHYYNGEISEPIRLPFGLDALDHIHR